MKTFLVFACTCMLTFSLWGQETKGNIGNTGPVKYQQQLMYDLSPQSATFKKYINHEISESSGVPQIEIPLYTIKLHQISIPIVLSYNASGIKYRQDDGDVGVGWSLSVDGYRIIKEIRGRDDFKGLKRYDYNEHKKNKEAYENSIYPGYFMNSYNASFSYVQNLMPDRNSKYLYNEHNAQDGEKDLYNYLIPTANGQYLMPGDKPYLSQTFSIKKNNLKVNFISQEEWSLTDNCGNVFSLGGSNKNEVCHEIYKDPRYLIIDKKNYGSSDISSDSDIKQKTAV